MPPSLAEMKRTYAVKWREPNGRTYVGRLALGVRTLDLEGRESGGPIVDRQLEYAGLRSLRLANGRAGRLDGRPTLVVDRYDGIYLITSAGGGVGLVQELVERLAPLTAH
jgi:hypothetical protein